MSTLQARARQGLHSVPLLLLPLLLWAGLAAAQNLAEGARHYDARAGLSRALTREQLRSQAQSAAGPVRRCAGAVGPRGR